MSRPTWLSTLAKIAQFVFVAISPLVVYLALTRWGLLTGAWIVVGWLTLRMIPTWLSAPPEHRKAVLKLPLCALVFALIGAVSQAKVLVLAMPSLTQLGFSWVFLSTLRTEQIPLIQRFAEMQKPSLTPEERAHTRLFTWVWGLSLVLTAVVGLVLAALAPLEIWAAFTGIGAYLFVAGLFVVEYLVRAVRFRRLRDNLLQRALVRVWP